MLAGQGDQRGAQAALDLARAWAGRGAAGDPLQGLFPEARADGFEASTWMLLGQPAKALAAEHRALAQLGPELLHDRALGLASMARALALLGEVEHACAVAHEALDILQVTRAAGGLRWARRAVREVRRRAPGKPCVVELTDRLVTLAAPG